MGKNKNYKALTHLDIAKKVIECWGTENIVFQNNKFILWNKEKGIWEIKKNPNEIKLLIIHNSKNTTSYGIDSILKIIALLTENENIKFNSSNSLNCLNGEIYFTASGIELQPHNNASFSTIQIPVRYNPSASADRFKKFIKEIFEFDKDSIEKQSLLLEFIGYSLSKSTNLEKMLILVGQGSNGKSTLFEVIQKLCGDANVAAVQPTEFKNKFQRAFLENKLVNLISELEIGKRIDEGKLKAIISGDKSTVEEKYGSPYNVAPFVTCWIGTNHLPPLKDFSDGFFRRVEILEFKRQFKVHERDLDLKAKLLNELEGILLLALNAYQRVIQNNKLTHVPSSEDAIQNWRTDTDQVKWFFEEKLEFDELSTLESREVYDCYRQWSYDNHIRIPIGHSNFTSRLCYLGVTKQRTACKRMLNGIRFKRDINLNIEIELHSKKTQFENILL